MEKIFPWAWRDQPIDRAGSHGHPSTPKSRPKRRVEPSGENKLPITLNLQDPFFRLTGCHPRKRVVFPLRSSQRGQLLLTKLATFPVGIEPPGPRQGGKFNTQGAFERSCRVFLLENFTPTFPCISGVSGVLYFHLFLMTETIKLCPDTNKMMFC